MRIESDDQYDSKQMEGHLEMKAKKIRKLTALLAQEQKLTAHLDEQVSNLTEKNGNQFTQLEGLRDELASVDKQLKARTESLDVSQYEWKLRGERILEWKAKAEQMEVERDLAAEARNSHWAEVVRLSVTLKEVRDDMGELVHARNHGDKHLTEKQEKINELQIELIDANQEAQNHALMIHKIVDAMTAAGYDISGWGNDEQLTELEELTANADREINGIMGALDNIRTER